MSKYIFYICIFFILANCSDRTIYSGKIINQEQLRDINFENREKIRPSGFIHGKHKIYVSLNNGRILTVDSSTGIQEKITKIHRSKISRPYIFKKSMYLIKDNGIAKIK